LAATLIVAACEPFPRDPAGTLLAVHSSGVLNVGVINHPPWATCHEDQTGGIEFELAAGFATALDVKPEWRCMAEATAIRRLENGELDLVIGGLTSDSPRRHQSGFTRPYLITPEDPHAKEHVLAVRRGENGFLVALERYLRSRPVLSDSVDAEQE
jgi:membrane-bound lytic murein transglycosylase MltF